MDVIYVVWDIYCDDVFYVGCMIMFDDGVWVVYVFVDECIDICVGVMIGMFVYVLLIDVDGVVLCGVVVGDMVYLYGVGGFVCLYGELFVFGVVFGVWFVDL